VYVLNSGKVPIAQRGTVVGVTRSTRQTWLDIVFDTSFMSGTSLGERCDPFYGASVPSNSVLNVSNRQCVAESKASASRKPVTSNQPLTVPGYGMPVGPNGRGQSFPASAPAPLQHSWRNAAAGQTRGHHGGLPFHGRGGSSQTNGGQQDGGASRGRAGYANTNSRGNDPQSGGRGRGRGGAPAPNRSGYTVVDKVDSTLGNGSSSYQPGRSYNNVPPPASLNDNATSRGGRGRGGTPQQNGRGSSGRGRGGRGRARGPSAS